MDEREKIARILNPAVWNDAPDYAEMFEDDPAKKKRYLDGFHRSVAARREPYLHMADLLIAAGYKRA